MQRSPGVFPQARRSRGGAERSGGESEPTDALNGLIASIEHTVENFRQADIPRWKHRQIMPEQQEAADAALAEATGVEEPAYSFGGTGICG